MTHSPVPASVQSPALERSRLAQRLRRVLRGEVLFDAFSRGRYASDASPHHAEPVGVVVPADTTDVLAAIDLAAQMQVPMLPRGAGTSGAGQAIGEALVLDLSRSLNRIIAFDPAAGIVQVEPGVTLAQLDAFLRPRGFFFPVELTGAPHATLGGVVGNNACGLRALGHGQAVHRLHAVDAVLADGTQEFFGPFGARAARPMGSTRTGALVSRLFEIAMREREEIARAWPRTERRIGGYNLDAFHPVCGRPYTADGSVNLAHLLAGSEGSLAHFLGLYLRVAPVPAHRVLATVVFPTDGEALAAVASLADGPNTGGPDALLLLDPEALERGRRDPATARALAAPDAGAALLIEFSGADPDGLRRRLVRLTDEVAALPGRASVVVCDVREAEALWSLSANGWRQAGASPGAFGCIDDCAVPIARLPEYHEGMTALLARHGARADWSGQVGLGAPRLRLMRQRAGEEVGERRERLHAISEEVAALATRMRGVFVGGHGEGETRGAFAARAFGPRLSASFSEIKTLFDPAGLMNPGKVLSVRPEVSPQPRPRAAAAASADLALTWNTAAFAACGGEGECRSLDDGWMCPSFRATRLERDSPRGRANTFRLALSGRLGADALASPAMADTMATCIGCKACRSACPSGVDVARMRIEVLNRTRRDRAHHMSAGFPPNAPWLARLGWRLGLRDRVPGVRRLIERWLGLAAKRSLPRLRRDTFLRGFQAQAAGPVQGREVVLFADCFGNHLAPENLHAAVRVLRAAGWQVHVALPSASDPEHQRPLCCGRTSLIRGDVDAARAEAGRTLQALAPYLERGIDVIGLEPACLLTMRDEFLALELGEAAQTLAARALLFEEFVAREHAAGRFPLQVGVVPWARALVQPHCHQNAFGTVDAMRYVLNLVPGLAVDVLDAGCCGMGDGFGMRAEHFALSMRMAAEGPMPALAAADAQTVLIADGIGCRLQITDAAQRSSMHLARVLDVALGGPQPA